MAGGASTGISVLQLSLLGWLQHPGGHDPWWPCLGWELDQMEVPSNLHPYVFTKEKSEGTASVREGSRCE